jgi:hypothetical protein
MSYGTNGIEMEITKIFLYIILQKCPKYRSIYEKNIKGDFISESI